MNVDVSELENLDFAQARVHAFIKTIREATEAVSQLVNKMDELDGRMASFGTRNVFTCGRRKGAT